MREFREERSDVADVKRTYRIDGKRRDLVGDKIAAYQIVPKLRQRNGQWAAVGGPATFQIGPTQTISEETGISRRLVKVIISAVDIVDWRRRQLVGSEIVKQGNLDCPEIPAQCFSHAVRGRADAAIFAEVVVKVRPNAPGRRPLVNRL